MVISRRGAVGTRIAFTAALVGLVVVALGHVSVVLVGGRCPWSGLRLAAWHPDQVLARSHAAVSDTAVVELLARLWLSCAWLAIASVAANVVVELQARLGGRPAVRPVRGLRWSQAIARRLVAVALALPVAAPLSTGPVHAATPTDTTDLPVGAVPATPAARTESARSTHGGHHVAELLAPQLRTPHPRGRARGVDRPAAVQRDVPTSAWASLPVVDPPGMASVGLATDADVTEGLLEVDRPPANAGAPEIVVEPRDSPWRLAEKHLGDGMRWRELYDLNRGVPQADGRAWTEPELIVPGWRLRLPADASPALASDAVVHVVRSGDTLSGLASRYLGDPCRYLELYAANGHVVQPDGRHLSDPDLIVVGWRLAIPTTRPPAPALPAPASGVDDTPQPNMPPGGTNVPGGDSPSRSTPTAPASTPPPRSTSDLPAASPRPPIRVTSRRSDHPNASSVLAATASVVLATGVLLELHRRRRRRGGWASSTELPTERALRAVANESLVRWASWHLAAMLQEVDPRLAGLVAVEFGETSGIEVLWDSPLHTRRPEGWTVADGGWAWRLAYDPDRRVPAVPHAVAGPTLVTIGHRDGRQLLVDLEAFGVLTITGPPERRDALARSMALELAYGEDFLTDSSVTVVGVDLDPESMALRRLTIADAATAADLLTDITTEAAIRVDRRRSSHKSLRDDAPRAATVIVASGEPAPGLVDWFTAVRPRTGVAVVATASESPSAGAAWIEIDPNGTAARLEPLGIGFEPVGVAVGAVDTIASAVATFADLSDRVGTEARVPVSPAAPLDYQRREAGGEVSAQPAGEVDEDVPIPVTIFEPVAEVPDADMTRPDRVLGAVARSSDHQLVVRLLGVPRIDARPDIGRRELVLAVLLACRGGRVATTAAQDALWGGRAVEAKTVWNLVAGARRALGEFEDGSPVMPAADRTRGTLHLDPRVTTDLALLREAATTAEQLSSAEATVVLLDALELVEGPPFDAPGYDWAHRDQDVADATTVIARVVDRVVELALDAGQLDVARQAIMRGLRAMPGDEHLYRARMRVESTAGNHAGIVAAYDELCLYVAEFDAKPSPVTMALYHELKAQTVRK